jgi:hypothetical protein
MHHTHTHTHTRMRTQSGPHTHRQAHPHTAGPHRLLHRAPRERRVRVGAARRPFGSWGHHEAEAIGGQVRQPPRAFGSDPLPKERRALGRPVLGVDVALLAVGCGVSARAHGGRQGWRPLPLRKRKVQQVVQRPRATAAARPPSGLQPVLPQRADRPSAVRAQGAREGAHLCVQHTAIVAIVVVVLAATARYSRCAWERRGPLAGAGCARAPLRRQ